MTSDFESDRFYCSNLLEANFESSKIQFGDPNCLSLTPTYTHMHSLLDFLMITLSAEVSPKFIRSLNNRLVYLWWVLWSTALLCHVKLPLRKKIFWGLGLVSFDFVLNLLLLVSLNVHSYEKRKKEAVFALKSEYNKPLCRAVALKRHKKLNISYCQA